MGKYRIITFEGGGIRGALTITLLKRLQARFPELIDSAHLLAGTSTGSFIALGLAAGMAADDIAALYSEETGRFIFTPRYLEALRPKYDNEHLRQKVASVFHPELRLKDLKRRVLIPSFQVTPLDTGSWRPVFYHNFPSSTSLEEAVLDVAMASSAAPVYFPSYHGYIDGGVMANDPGVAAIAAAKDMNMGNQELKDVYLLSLGTGSSPQAIAADTTRWGGLQWLLYPSPPFPLLTVLLDGVVEADVHFCRQLLGSQYFRLNPILPESIPLDAYEKIPALVGLGEVFDLEPTAEWISRNWF